MLFFRFRCLPFARVRPGAGCFCMRAAVFVGRLPACVREPGASACELPCSWDVCPRASGSRVLCVRAAVSVGRLPVSIREPGASACRAAVFVGTFARVRPGAGGQGAVPAAPARRDAPSLLDVWPFPQSDPGAEKALSAVRRRAAVHGQRHGGADHLRYPEGVPHAGGAEQPAQQESRRKDHDHVARTGR